MRAGPLSNDQVIRLLNSQFVPVFISNEDYQDAGPAPADEREALERIGRETLLAQLPFGTVHAYILAPDGRVSDAMHVDQAAKVERTLAMLEHAVARFKPKAGEPVVKRVPAARAPRTPEHGLVLHLVARYLRKQGDELATLIDEAGLGQTNNSSWQAYPAENWIVWEHDDVQKLLPRSDVRVGQTWQLDRDVLARVLIHCYPSTECNDPARNRIERQELQATVVSINEGVARARLVGRLRMKHHFYPGQEDDNFVEASLLGYLDYDNTTRRIRELRLVTDEGMYAGAPFGAAVQMTHQQEAPNGEVGTD